MYRHAKNRPEKAVGDVMDKLHGRGAALAQPSILDNSLHTITTVSRGGLSPNHDHHLPQVRTAPRKSSSSGAADGLLLAQARSGMSIDVLRSNIIFLNAPVLLVPHSRFVMQAKLADSLWPIPFPSPTSPSGMPQVGANLGEAASHPWDIVSPSADSERPLLSF